MTPCRQCLSQVASSSSSIWGEWETAGYGVTSKLKTNAEIKDKSLMKVGTVASLP